MTSFRLLSVATLGLTLSWACSSAEEETTTGGGGIDWSGAGAGGASVGGSGTTGGAGPGPGGSAPGGGNTGGDADGGGGTGGTTVLTGTVVAVAVGPTNGITGSSVAGAAWTTAALGEGSIARPAMATLAGGDAVATFLGGTAVVGVAWSGSAFGPPSEYAAGPAQGAPAFTAIASIEHLAYHGADFLHYYGQGEPIAPAASPQSFGPSAPAIAAVPGEAVVAFAGDDGSLYAQSRSGGQWQPAVNVVGSLAQRSPALVALEGSGPDLLMTWVNHDPVSTDHTKIAFATRTGNAWSTPALIGSAVFTADDITLAALPGGDALLAYRGTDAKAYTVRFAAGSWGAPQGIATPNPDVASAPGVAMGVDGYDAELCYAGGDGAAYHVRLDASGFTAPATIGGTSLVHCAIAAIP